MPVEVCVPIRLVVDPHALVSCGDEVDDAFASALGRALAASRDVVVRPRGGYLGIRAHAPTFTWVGPALDTVPARIRSELEARLRSLVREAVESCGLLEEARAAEQAPEPLADEPAEIADPERLSAGLGLYMVPSYDGQGRLKPVPTKGAVKQRSAGRVSALAWPPLTEPSEFFDAFHDALHEKYGDSLPPTGYVAGIYRLPGADPDAYWISIYDLAHEEAPVWEHWISTRGGSFDPDEHTGEIVHRDYPLAPVSGYSILAIADAADASAVRQAVEAQAGDWLRAALARIAPKKGMTPQDTADFVQRRYDALIDARVKFLTANPHIRVAKLMLIGVPNGQGLLVGISDDAAALPTTGLPIPLFPLVPRSAAAVPPARATKGTGKGAFRAGKKGAGQAGETKGRGEDKGESKVESKSGKGGKGQEGVEGGAAEGGEGFVRGEDSGAPGTFFPPELDFWRLLNTTMLECVAFEGEPSIDDMGDDGKRLKQMIARVAYRLQIPTCQYAGNFCINAANAFASRTAQVASFSRLEKGSTKAVEGGKGNLGNVQFEPLPSPAVQLLRHLGATVPIFEALVHEVETVMQRQEHAAKIQSWRKDDGIGWTLDFLEEVNPTMNESVASIFVFGCQILMLQLLRTSREAIEQRRSPENFDKYAAYFTEMVRTVLAQESDLMDLRETLNGYVALLKPSAAAEGQVLLDMWRAAHREVNVPTELLSDLRTAAHDASVAPVSPATTWADAQASVTATLDPAGTKAATAPSATAKLRGMPVMRGQELCIFDAKGHAWSMNELQRAIAMQQNLAESIDPIVKQLLDLPGTMAILGPHPELAKAHLKNLLDEMADKNDEITTKTTDDTTFAFQHGTIDEDVEQATVPGTSFRMGGIHLLVHQAIGDSFGGSHYYADGIELLFGARAGYESVMSFLTFTGLVLLAVLCPPAATIIGIGQAVEGYEEAKENEDIYKSLIDPELVISRAEVEIGLFMGELGIALAVIPEAGSIVKRASGAIDTLVEQGLRQGVKTIAREAIHEVLLEMMQQLKKNLAKAFVEEIVKALAMQKLLEIAVEPVIEDIENELRAPPPPPAAAAGETQFDWSSLPISPDDEPQR